MSVSLKSIKVSPVSTSPRLTTPPVAAIWPDPGKIAELLGHDGVSDPLCIYNQKIQFRDTKLGFDLQWLYIMDQIILECLTRVSQSGDPADIRLPVLARVKEHVLLITTRQNLALRPVKNVAWLKNLTEETRLRGHFGDTRLPSCASLGMLLECTIKGFRGGCNL